MECLNYVLLTVKYFKENTAIIGLEALTVIETISVLPPHTNTTLCS